MLRVGFIGIGNMGKGMAVNLGRKLKRSHPQAELIVYDPSTACMTSFLKKMSSLKLSTADSIPIKVSSIVVLSN